MVSGSLFCPYCGAVYSSGEKQCTFCQHIFADELDLFEKSDLFHERYQILNQIGTGGFGAVYKARDIQEQQRLVAIKQINLRGLTAQEIIEATDGFNRERQFLSSLAHDHLPRIYDHFMDTEHWYLIMEFIEGQTLEVYLQLLAGASTSFVRALSVDEIVDIGLQLCDVLSYLHGQRQPIIFRDLKPSNVMRTDLGAIYLIDFGIARYFKPGKLKDTIPFGSPGYAAPEQYGKGQTTVQADIYSLGAMLYYMLSGLDPAENPFHFVPLRLYGTAGLAELEALIMQMVALDVQQRPNDVQEVTVELQHIRRLRGSSEHRIWRPPTISTVPTSGSSPYWQGSGGQSGQQQSQMPPSQAQSQKAVAQGTTRRTLLIGFVITVGAIIFSRATSSFQSSSGVNIEPEPYNAEAHWPDMELLLNTKLPNRLASITSVLHSPVNGLLAVGDQVGNIFVLNMEMACTVVYQWRVPNPVTSLSWSLDAKYLSVAAGRSVYIWDKLSVADGAKTGQASKDPWTVHDDILPDTVQTVRWSPLDPMTLAVGDVDGNVSVFQISSGGRWNSPLYKVVGKLKLSRLANGPSVIVSWVGELLYSVYDRDSVNVWDLHNPQHKAINNTFAGLGANEYVQEVLELVGLKRLAVLTTLGQIRFFDEDYQTNQLLSNVGDIISALVHSTDGLYVFGATNKGIHIWSVESPMDQPHVFAPQFTMLSIDATVNKTGKIIIAGGPNGVLQIWRDRSS